MIYISGGKYKKRKIEVETNIVRPTSSSKRESIFSILESFAIKSSLEISLINSLDLGPNTPKHT